MGTVLSCRPQRDQLTESVPPDTMILLKKPDLLFKKNNLNEKGVA
jgi:hypothetical protein